MTIEIEGTRFGFSRTANDDFDNGTKNVDGAVVVSRGRILKESYQETLSERKRKCLETS